MNNIILRAEKELRTWQRPFSLQSIHNVSDAVSHAAMNIAEDMRARVIISLTRSGSTARMVSKYRPLCPVIAATPWVNTWRELALLWGVYPIMREEAKNAEEAVESALAAVVEYGVAQEGDLVVITAGVPVGIPGTTNMVEVHTIGRILVKGRSLIKKEATGHVKLAKSPREADEKIMQGDILVVTQTNKNYIPAMRKAAAIITEEGGLTSHAAIVALELGIPCVVSAKDCMKLLQDDMIITVDGTRGVVYQGRVKLH